MRKIETIKKTEILLIGILVFQLTFSQENYSPGYIIKNNTDTLFGFLDYRNWEVNPNQIKFKTNIEDNPVLYNPIEITEFKVKNEIYVSGIVNNDISPRQTSKLQYGTQKNLKADTIFLQTLVKGDKSLFYYKNSSDVDNFYIKKDAGFDLLIYKRYLNPDSDKDEILVDKNYLTQLKQYLNDCENINSKLENTLYDQKNLIKLFQYYYECSSSAFTFQKEIDKVRTEIGALAGVSTTYLKFRGSGLPYLINTDFDISVNPTAGIFFNFVLPRNQGKWSLYNELLFTTYKAKGRYEEYVNDENYTISTMEIGYSYLTINNLVRFTYPIGEWHMFFNAGISNSFSVNETNYRRKDIKYYTTNTIKEELALDATRKYEQGYLLGTGIKYNKFTLEVRFGKGSGMADYATLTSSTTRNFFLLGYRF